MDKNLISILILLINAVTGDKHHYSVPKTSYSYSNLSDLTHFSLPRTPHVSVVTWSKCTLFLHKYYPNTLYNTNFHLECSRLVFQKIYDAYLWDFFVFKIWLSECPIRWKLESPLACHISLYVYLEQFILFCTISLPT